MNYDGCECRLFKIAVRLLLKRVSGYYAMKKDGLGGSAAHQIDNRVKPKKTNRFLLLFLCILVYVLDPATE